MSEANAVPAETVAERKDPLASLAGQIAYLPNGERAFLRRMYLAGNRPERAVGVVMGLLHRAGVPSAVWRNEKAFGRWCLLAHVAALLSGTAGLAPHAPGRRLGQALFTAGYSENRLLRLTAARGLALEDQVRCATRYLAQAGMVPVDLRTIYDLISDDSARAERARLDIARDYYGAAHASEGDTK